MADKNTFTLEIATPERLLLREQVNEAQIPAKGGFLGVLPEHAPLLSELGAGRLTYTMDGRTEAMAVSGGFVEVQRDHVRVLANHAEKSAEIDIEQAKKALDHAMSRMQSLSEGIDIASALDDVYREQARVDTANNK